MELLQLFLFNTFFSKALNNLLALLIDDQQSCWIVNISLPLGDLWKCQIELLLNILRMTWKHLLQIIFSLSYRLTTTESKLIVQILLVCQLNITLNMGRRFLRYVSHCEIKEHWSTTNIRIFSMWLKECHETK